ncbi:hypothetical protein [Nocardia sp. NPDC050710]|uniref:hypothetical protein n=1 Tax=Nocardia sp. NPDC050710 TaxID=3157220 RepID=UPI0033D4DFC0
MTGDATMNAITEAVALGHAGHRDAARSALGELWTSLGPHGDPLHRCTLAHYLADLQEDAAQALAWDIRAIDAADAVSNERAEQYDPALDVRGFYPSLHLNLADNYRRLASFDAAQREVDAARATLHTLGEDGYGTTIRTALDGVEAAIRARNTRSRESAPH